MRKFPRDLTVHMSEQTAAIIERQAIHDDVSTSTYIRNVLLEHLVNRGLLANAQLLKEAQGTPATATC